MPALREVTLEDRYTREDGRVLMTGIQALVRLPMLQRQRDLAAGLNTAGFVSGYRGSPLGGLDQAMWRASAHLERHHVRFQPGINEDLAATAVWGTQQVNLFEGASYDGVFALWYGKGPGVDRCGDVFKHANAAGTSRHGGVLAIAGDDHACKSSTLPHQSEYAFIDAQIPVLNPAGVAEVLQFGLQGIALSRYSGCWVALKTIAETADSSATIDIGAAQPGIVLPEDFDYPAQGLHIRWPDQPLAQEHRLQREKLYAALAFARANQLNRVVVDSPQPRLGIVTTGKSHLDVMQALEDLHIDAAEAARIGLRVYKVGMSWPLEREGVRSFAQGLEEVLVVEEKRALIENQIKEQLYNWRNDVRPRVIGKFDDQGEWVLPSTGELTPARIARVIAARIERFYTSDAIRDRLDFLDRKEAALSRPRPLLERVAHFCSGCPHNTSTRVPQGSRAMAGIGCHYMATWMDRDTETFTQMGGEGVPWVGQAPFTGTAHVFANLGDGTYFHSGLLAIRATVAARVNITFKILYNDAVAMTGGQPVDGSLSVAQITHQLYGEGVRRIAVVDGDGTAALEPAILARGVTLHRREQMDALQHSLRETTGTSVLIYVQTCAAEKRRRRKRGKLADPPRRVFINHLVCEGCGDCSVQSNCLSVVPLKTELGTKRTIDQSSCNKDFSCLDGFCPSFVSVHGAELRKPDALEPSLALPPPPAPRDGLYDIVITGVGGTGVVTVGALLAMAAHLESKGCTVLDMTGLAQKFGAVVSHVRIAPQPGLINSVRIPAGGADLLLGCDLVVASGFDALSKVDSNYSRALVNAHEAMTAQFIHDRDLDFDGAAMRQAIVDSVGPEQATFVDATRLATALCGDAIAANLFMLGYACQAGLLPLSVAAMERAIELNGVAVDANKRAFTWGRCQAHDPETVARALGRDDPPPPPAGLDELIEHRAQHLTAYQDQAYGARYRQRVERVRQAEAALAPGEQALTRAVAENYARLLAYKDEYEVARLYSDGRFQRAVQRQFSGNPRLQVHLAAPLLARRDPHSGRPRKRAFGGWVLRLFPLLARARRLRGSWLDPFGYQAERRLERELVSDYEALLEQLLDGLEAHNYAIAVQLAALPAGIRGFGHVKQGAIEQARQERQRLLVQFRRAPVSAAA